MKTLQLSIESLRKEIDDIDNKIIELICERMKRVAEIGKIKMLHGIEIYHPEREISLIQNLIARSASAGIDEKMVLSIWYEIMKASKQLQIDIGMGNE